MVHDGHRDTSSESEQLKDKMKTIFEPIFEVSDCIVSYIHIILEM